MTRNSLLVALAVVGALCIPVQADLVHYEIGPGSSVSANQGLGLIINTAVVVPTGSANDLNDGGSWTFDFFDIWTTENSVDWDDILVPGAISATLNFAAPPGSAEVTGQTFAFTLGFASTGVLVWQGPDTVTSGGVTYEVSLSDEFFNGKWGTRLNPGREHGATVQATVTQLSSGQGSPVPAPAAPLLVMVGLGLVGWLKRRIA